MNTPTMHIGIAFDLKPDAPVAADLPDDWVEEFDSPATVQAIAAALRAKGHATTELGDGRGLIEKLLADPPDIVFNIAEGIGVGRSREARVPAVCEMLGVPYTGSDPLSLAAALDKDVARRLVASAGVQIPWGMTPADGAIPEQVPYPAIVKPAWEGSSKGIRDKCLVHSADELNAAIDKNRRYHQPVLVEEFIAGDELTVGVIGNDPPCVLGVMRVIPNRADGPFVYSLEVKRDFRNLVTYECPARLAPDILAAVRTAALISYDAIGCRDVARIDFRLRDGVPYFIEANPLPGLNPESSDLVILGDRVGISHEQLIGMIVDAARDR
ncbi:MAG TPA: ATP-grasp domain-containing protein, partial [Gemmataceae bacterium]|nr:ATP-grasp domain-containing protein [Gemmataceae bacterium]